MEWIVRPIRAKEASGARRLIEAVWHEHFDQRSDPFVRNFIYSRLSDVDNAEQIYGDRAIFLCAIARDAVVGTGAIKHVDDQVCEMTRMFVAPSYRGRGIGREIAGELIGFARRTGYYLIRLSTNNALVASHRLYERIGFRPVSSWEPGSEVHSRHFVLQL